MMKDVAIRMVSKNANSRLLLDFWPNLRRVTFSGQGRYSHVESLNLHMKIARGANNVRARIVSENGVEKADSLIPRGFLSDILDTSDET
jgi:hypothetical protein